MSVETAAGQWPALAGVSEEGGKDALRGAADRAGVRATTATARQAMQANGQANESDQAAKKLRVTMSAQQNVAFGGATKSG